MTVHPLDPGDTTIGIWSPGLLADDLVELELTPFTDDDPRVQAAEALLAERLGGDSA